MAEALAPGADVVAVGTAAVIALGDNHPSATPSTVNPAPQQAISATTRTAATRPASPPRTRGSPPAWIPWRPVVGRRTTCM
ncbi:hypothetical protein [Streptomyces sp. NPDC001604]|uniref:hypothetical protein n=1 Tax=Streptomyces sp. NPDC001604 TaxID=3364593 RepID=UPI0036A6482D